MKTRVPLAVLFAAAALPLAALDTVGKIAYLEGTVEIVRDEDTLDPALVKTGLALQNFDLLKTGSDGQVEVQITSPMAPATTIRVAPRTQFSLEIGKAGSRQQTTVGLLIGSVTLKCAKLTGSQSVKVQTDTTIMGVRGTSFTVTAATSGDVLVACDEGEVECIDEDGNEEQAKPGEVVEKLFEERFRRLPVAVSSLEQFKRNWNTERISALKANAGKSIVAFAVRYKTLLIRFNRDFEALEKAQKTIDTWRAEDRAGRIGTTQETMAQRKELNDALKKLRLNLFFFERIYVRLLELKEYHDEGFGRGTIRYGLTSETTTQFFQRLESDRRVLERKMAKVRSVARLFALRNDGRVPWGGFGDEEDDDSFSGE
ncbi:MAG: FecR family protein [Spirochaetes bacterium]|nr:FecR family protein [Spirochaetota bacterium]